MFYAVFTDDGLDQICDTQSQANREARDLRRLGCGGVKVRPVADDDEAERIAARIRGY